MFLRTSAFFSLLTDRGKYLVVWKRGADGNWRLHRDIFNSSLPPS